VPARTVKFYQTGTFTVGNRLLAEEDRAGQSDPKRLNTLTSGHRACQGCGEALGARYALDAAMRSSNNQLIVANATGCLEVFSTPYPESSWRLPWMHSLFGNAAAVATGIAAAMRVKGRPEVRVVAQGGDNRRGVHAQAGQRVGHREGVVDVRLAGLAQLGAVRVGRESIGTPNRFDVWSRQIFADIVEECLWAARSRRSSSRHGGLKVYN